MYINKKLEILKWCARIVALVLLIFGLLFYFGYGNPLPFVNPDYTWIENVWLTLVPLMFVGLAVGWKFEKVGGYLIILPLIIGFILGVIAEANFSVNMLILSVPGILYLVVGYNSSIHISEVSEQ